MERDKLPAMHPSIPHDSSAAEPKTFKAGRTQQAPLLGRVARFDGEMNARIAARLLLSLYLGRPNTCPFALLSIRGPHLTESTDLRYQLDDPEIFSEFAHG